jgi:23S rRNA pseudouridine1911/1915/1917 synthase
MTNDIEILVTEENQGIRLDKFASSQCTDLSRHRLQTLIEEGNVHLNGVVAPGKTKVKIGDRITIHVPENIDHYLEPQDLNLNIVFEDEHIIVINKDPGMVVHPAPGHLTGTIVNGLLAHCGPEFTGIGGVRRPGLVHRLDKGTSGLMVVAKTEQAYHHLVAQFASRTIRRQYYAIVWGVPQPMEGTISTMMGRHPKHRQKMAVLKDSGKQAVTHYLVVEAFGRLASLVQCRLETGRTHQIRVHMTHMGHSLVGDPIYGRSPRGLSQTCMDTLNQESQNISRPALHAYHLRFIHPHTHRMVKFYADIPEDLESMITALSLEGAKTLPRKQIKTIKEEDDDQCIWVYEGDDYGDEE